VPRVLAWKSTRKTNLKRTLELKRPVGSSWRWRASLCFSRPIETLSAADESVRRATNRTVRSFHVSSIRWKLEIRLKLEA